ncbi:MAG: PAS domain-containing protein [Ignavibacteria bacterium]|nr:PAS domain-containing protein [Ignavibacteria bacterium]
MKQTELNRISRDLVSRKKELVVATEKQEETKEELQSSKEELIVATEKQEETKEELQTSNEELQTANEELQSSNEELETMKEELQSTNEELITVNEELRVKNIDLSLVNSDLFNILNSIRLSIVIVDNHLRIKKFTKDAGKLLNIIQSDTGRKITDLHHNVIIKNLRGLLKEVIETPEIKILEVRDNKNAFYSMRIRPYKTVENKIDGAIITFVDISEIKTGVQKLTDLQNETKKITNNLEHIVKKGPNLLNLSTLI